MDEISIVADSTADLPEEIIREYDIQIVRNLIILDGKSLQDGIDISREEYYTRLPDINPPPTTATASSGVYQQIYESLFRRGAKQILSIHPPLNLSGIINAATIASNAFGNRVHIFDSGQLSLGSGFQILAAAEAVRKGANLETVIRLMTGMRKRARIIAMLDTLEYVRRSGRVSWARARIGNLLQIKPFIELKEGVVTSLGECRTRGKGFQRLMEFLSQSGNLERLAILHTNAEEDALRFQERIKHRSAQSAFDRQCHHGNRDACWTERTWICSCQTIRQIAELMKPSLQKLQKFFKLEAERGYDNRAVLGGLDRMLDLWESEARSDEVPEELIQIIRARILDYSRLSEKSRAEALQGLWRRMQRTENAELIEPASEPQDLPAPNPHLQEIIEENIENDFTSPV